MNPNEGLLPRPDLDEFLTALNGFLVKQTSPSDPSQIRFLEIFFRSVKANKGHLLKISDEGVLRSVVSFGVEKGFDDEFNATQTKNSADPTPLDMACSQKDAVAIVDAAKDPDIPAWYGSFLKKYGFSSLVAVPLMGADKPVGILCAYYDDVCLFDRATLGHLMTIGRMVGGATEKSMAADRVETHGEKEKAIDQFLRILCGQPFSNLQMFEILTKVVKDAVPADGFFCGPIKKSKDGWLLTVVSGFGFPEELITRQVVVPQIIAKQFMSSMGKGGLIGQTPDEWGKLQPFFGGNVSMALSHPLSWRNNIEGLALAWRVAEKEFDTDDDLLLARLASIAAIALHST